MKFGVDSPSPTIFVGHSPLGGIEVNMKVFIAWIVAFLLAKSPLGQPQYGSVGETPQAREARYGSIATDLSEVIASEPPFYAGDHGLVRTASVMLSVAFFESGFSARVDNGTLRGDAGKSVCLMQLNVGKGKTPPWNKVTGRYALPSDNTADVEPGWTAAELIADRKKCFRAAHRLMRMSIASCSRYGALESLRAYASGSCGGGSPESRARMSVAVRWYDGHIPTFSDAVIMGKVAPPVLLATP